MFDLTGRTAWVLWRTAYMTRSMSLKNRVMIPFYVSIDNPISLSLSLSPSLGLLSCLAQGGVCCVFS